MKLQDRYKPGDYYDGLIIFGVSDYGLLLYTDEGQNCIFVDKDDIINKPEIPNWERLSEL